MSVAKSCFVRCRGCYNHFARSDNLASSDAITTFLRSARSCGINAVTLCGGDPLARKDILGLTASIKKLGLWVTLDTVGTPFLSDADTIFFGNFHVPRVDPGRLVPLVDLLGIALDGSSNARVLDFRTGRANLLEEQLRILEILDHVDARVCINTVLHRRNAHDVVRLVPLIARFRSIVKWQVFQFTPTGPLGYRNKDAFVIETSEFLSREDQVKTAVAASAFAGAVEFKSNSARKGNYLLVDSEGLAWIPSTPLTPDWDDARDATRDRLILGNICDVSSHESILKAVLLPREVLPPLLGIGRS